MYHTRTERGGNGFRNIWTGMNNFDAHKRELFLHRSLKYMQGVRVVAAYNKSRVCCGKVTKLLEKQRVCVRARVHEVLEWKVFVPMYTEKRFSRGFFSFNLIFFFLYLFISIVAENQHGYVAALSYVIINVLCCLLVTHCCGFDGRMADFRSPQRPTRFIEFQ